MSQQTQYLLKSGEIFRFNHVGKEEWVKIPRIRTALTEINRNPDLAQTARDIVTSSHGTSFLIDLNSMLDIVRAQSQYTDVRILPAD